MPLYCSNTGSTALREAEVQQPNTAAHLSLTSSFFAFSAKVGQSLDNANNKAFVPAFHKMWGEKTVIGDVTQAAYLGPWLWKLTVEKAKSFDIDKVAAASPGVEFKGAPEGYVRIHENHHLWSKTRVGRARADGQYDLIYETADLVEPDPFPKGYQ